VVQLIAFVVVIGTLLIQGLTLPALIRRLHAQDPQEHEEDVASEAYLYETTTDAALTYLDGLRTTWPEEHRPVLDRIATVVRSQGRAAIDGVREQLEEVEEEDEDVDAAKTLPLAVQEVWTGVLAAQRDVLLAERDAGRVDDEVMREVLHWIDLEEAAFVPHRGAEA
jgi:CPA1 family monovalent cation:H+ antiporter